MNWKSWKHMMVVVLALAILACASFAYASYSAFYVAGNNNVGIGTDTPTVPLHVAYDDVNTGNSNGQVLIGPYSTLTEGLSIGYNSDGHYAWLQSGNYGVAYHDLTLQPDQGNVGVKTITPTSRLTVNDGDVEVKVTDTSTYGSTPRGMILHAPDGHCARVNLTNGNSLSVTTVTCP
jgi:hypothetical protein